MFHLQLEFVRHIQDECRYILSATAGKTQEEAFGDETLKRAVVRSLEVMGEAAKRLDDEFRAQFPQVEWRKMAATRDVMIHHYFGIDYEIVWDIIHSKLPLLEMQLQEILEEN